MNREIRFRGFTTNKICRTKGWVYGIPLYFEDGPHIIDFYQTHDEICSMPSYGMHRLEPNSLGQYTGLKDANDVVIYEGDIILYDANMKYYVRYVAPCFCLYDKYGLQCYMEESSMYCYTVIGNIYENPELLNEA